MTTTVKTEKATVAPKRTIRAANRKIYRPGEEVELPVAEVKYFRDRGYLVDPKAEKSGDTLFQVRRPVAKRVG